VRGSRRANLYVAHQTGRLDELPVGADESLASARFRQVESVGEFKAVEATKTSSLAIKALAFADCAG
jgi:hypothetical protein